MLPADALSILAALEKEAEEERDGDISLVIPLHSKWKATKRENNYERMAKGNAQQSARDYGGYRYKCTAMNGMIVHRHKTIILQWLYQWMLQGGYLGIICKRNKPRGFSNVSKLFVLLEIQSTGHDSLSDTTEAIKWSEMGQIKTLHWNTLKFCGGLNVDLNCLIQAQLCQWISWILMWQRISEVHYWLLLFAPWNVNIWKYLCKTWNSRLKTQIFKGF